MHNRVLHDSLLAYVEEAAFELSRELEAGAEVQFELTDQGRSSSPLYCYHPLTDRFLTERSDILSRLPSYPAAVRQVAGLRGLLSYLRACGRTPPSSDPRVCAETALNTFLAANWANTTDFTFSKERFDAAYKQLEDAVYSDSTLVTVMAPVEGLLLESDEVALADGLTLAKSITLNQLPAELHCEDSPTVAMVQVESQRDDGLEVAGRRLRLLQTALRLWDDSEPLVGPIAWAQTGTSPWLLVALSSGMRRVSNQVSLPTQQEEKLRDLHATIARRLPRKGELAWALKRFELGCERPTTLEALSDWLLVASVLFGDDVEDRGFDHVAERIAAVIAVEDQQAVIQHVQEAIALERSIILGLVRPEAALESLIVQFGGYLRTVLREVLCGHLDSDLRTVTTPTQQPALALDLD